ncbi:MAG: NAD(P)H-binding protein [Kineosporiaceae bacterium]
MTVVVTAATGHLGRLVVEELLERGLPADQLVAAARRPEALDDVVSRGVTAARADYDDPQSLKDAFEGADVLVFVSGSEVGKRVAQHTAVVDAAVAAGVGLVVYTSIVHADTSPLPALAGEHLATEQALAASGLAHVVLRNSWYVENYTAQLPTYLAHGIAGSAGEGRISAATRADYAAAAAAVALAAARAGTLPAPGGDGEVSPAVGRLVYELGGEAFTMAELAATVTAVTGTEVTYTDLPEDAYTQVLVGAGLPHDYAAVLASADTGAKAGGLFTDSGDLARLAGRPLTSLEDAVRAAR